MYKKDNEKQVNIKTTQALSIIQEIKGWNKKEIKNLINLLTFMSMPHNRLVEFETIVKETKIKANILQDLILVLITFEVITRYIYTMKTLYGITDKGKNVLSYYKAL
jgi:predicted transcriptional regulator